MFVFNLDFNVAPKLRGMRIRTEDVATLGCERHQQRILHMEMASWNQNVARATFQTPWIAKCCNVSNCRDTTVAMAISFLVMRQ